MKVSAGEAHVAMDCTGSDGFCCALCPKVRGAQRQKAKDLNVEEAGKPNGLRVL